MLGSNISLKINKDGSLEHRKSLGKWDPQNYAQLGRDLASANDDMTSFAKANTVYNKFGRGESYGNVNKTTLTELRDVIDIAIKYFPTVTKEA